MNGNVRSYSEDEDITFPRNVDEIVSALLHNIGKQQNFAWSPPLKVYGLHLFSWTVTCSEILPRPMCSVKMCIGLCFDTS
jgi:hypothetical protein